MTIQRRCFLQLAASAAVLPAVSRIARARAYPSRPVRLIVGFPAGGTADTITRLMGQWLSERLGQQFVVDNRPGAASNIATEAVVRAPADGYTLLAITSANATNTTLYEKLSFDFLRDIVPVTSISLNPLVMVVNSSAPAISVPAFIAYAKGNPGKLSFASGGVGAASHLAGELFKMTTGVNMVHVPYRGAPPALTDMLGGQVQAMFVTLPEAIEHVRAGRLRALAVTTARRLEALPDVPPMADFLPGFEASGWSGFGAPKNTPAEIIEKLNREMNAGLADPAIKARIVDLGATVFPGSAAAFGKFVADETEKWRKVIRAANIKPE